MGFLTFARLVVLLLPTKLPLQTVGVSSEPGIGGEVKRWMIGDRGVDGRGTLMGIIMRVNGTVTYNKGKGGMCGIMETSMSGSGRMGLFPVEVF